MKFEDMKQLLVKDDTSPSGYKIVGYEWHRIVDGATQVTIWYREEGETDWVHTGEQEIDYDAFELGIKDGDEWFFEGDIIEFWHDDYENWINKNRNPPQIRATGILEIDKYGWVIKQLTGDANALYTYDSAREWSWAGLKRIGDIHEKTEVK